MGWDKYGDTGGIISGKFVNQAEPFCLWFSCRWGAKLPTDRKSERGPWKSIRECIGLPLLGNWICGGGVYSENGAGWRSMRSEVSPRARRARAAPPLEAMAIFVLQSPTRRDEERARSYSLIGTIGAAQTRRRHHPISTRAFRRRTQ
jgi:hypothetical protein